MAKGKVVKLKNPPTKKQFLKALKELSESTKCVQNLQKITLEKGHPDDKEIEKQGEILLEKLNEVKDFAIELLDPKPPKKSRYGSVDIYNPPKWGYFRNKKNPDKYINLKAKDPISDDLAECRKDPKCKAFFEEE